MQVLALFQSKVIENNIDVIFVCHLLLIWDAVMDKTAEDANQKHGHVDLSETSRQDMKTYFKDMIQFQYLVIIDKRVD